MQSIKIILIIILGSIIIFDSYVVLKKSQSAVLSADVRYLNEKIAELENAKTEHQQTLQIENNAVKTDVLRLRSEFRDMKSKADNLRSEVEAWKSESAKAMASNSDLQVEAEGLKAKIAKLTSENTNLKSDNSTLKADNSALQSERTSLKVENAILKKQIEALQRVEY